MRGKRSIVRAEILAIAERHGGQIGPRIVLHEAKDEASPLHAFFEWDDGAAAEAYRLGQAASLIREVNLEITVADQSPTEVTMEVSTVRPRAFYSLPHLRGSPGGSYVPASALSESDRMELAKEVLAQIEGLRRKHNEIRQLAGVWREVDKAREVIDAEAEQKPAKGGRKKRAA